MIEHHIEPLWVGMDVDTELARYEVEDRRRAEDVVAPTPKRPPRRRSLRAALPSLGKGAAPRAPITV